MWSCGAAAYGGARRADEQLPWLPRLSIPYNFALRQRLADRDIPCASVDGLLLLKLFALPSLYRQGDFARVALYEHDIAMLLRVGPSNVSQLFDELADHVSPNDLQELRSIVAEIEQRAARAAQRWGDAATAPPPAQER